jgi:hypothetical protein
LSDMLGFAKADDKDEDPDAIVKQLKAILESDIPEKAPETRAEKKKAFRPPRGAHLGIMLIQSLRSELRDTAGLEPPEEMVFKQKPKPAPVRKIPPKQAPVPGPAAIMPPAPTPIISKPAVALKPETISAPKLIRRIARFSPKMKPKKARPKIRMPKRKIRKKIIVPKPKPVIKPVKVRAKPKPVKAKPKPVKRSKPAPRTPKKKLSGRERLFRLLARRRRK